MHSLPVRGPQAAEIAGPRMDSGAHVLGGLRPKWQFIRPVADGAQQSVEVQAGMLRRSLGN